MTNKRIQSILKNFEDDSVLAIYLTGSRNNNLATESSDYDYIVVKKPTVNNLLGKLSKPKHTTGGECDYRTYDLVYFLNRTIVESIYNDAEVLWSEPAYEHEDYSEIKKILNKNKEDLINKERILSSLLGSLNQIYHKVMNTSGKVDLEKIKLNKELANFFRYETQMKKIYEGDIFYVRFEKEYREKFLEIKSTYPKNGKAQEAQDILKQEGLKQRLDNLVLIKESYQAEGTHKEETKKKIIEEILKIAI